MKTEIELAVGRALARFLDEPDSDSKAPAAELDRRERLVARKYRALPVLRDMLETVYLRPDGTFFGWDNDTPDQTDIVNDIQADGGNRTCLLVWGARRHPELVALLPPRPSDAKDCAGCDGTGHGPKVDMCYACYGLGWAVA